MVSRFARGPLDEKVSDKKEVEVAMTSDITSDHQSTALTSAMESDSVHSGTDTEIENEDLSEVRAGSAILPNLTIAIERDDDPGIVISFIKLKGLSYILNCGENCKRTSTLKLHFSLFFLN